MRLSENLPVDFLKIDGIFVKDMNDDPIDLAMVRSINEIGQLMGKQTIAEYVENETIRNQLRELGISLMLLKRFGRCNSDGWLAMAGSTS